MIHIIWTPSSKKRDQAEMICGLIAKGVDHRLSTTDKVEIGMDPGRCKECFGPHADKEEHRP